MKRPAPREKQTRFSGPLRHYHRTGAPHRGSWDDWINEKKGKSSFKGWWKILLILLGVLALGGIIAGLIIELG